jgi:putative spermidine/putrescine transport system permease protein
VTSIQSRSLWIRYPWLAMALGLAPMAIGLTGFLILPILIMVVGSFKTEQGWSIANYLNTIQGEYIKSFFNTLVISLVTAVVGGVLGTLTAIVLAWGPFQSSSLLTLTSVAANWGGVPLAFAMITTIGNSGWLTEILRMGGLDPHLHGFTVYSNVGLMLTYLYFQWPLMLLLLPAVQRFRLAWREAAESLGQRDRNFGSGLVFRSCYRL